MPRRYCSSVIESGCAEEAFPIDVVAPWRGKQPEALVGREQFVAAETHCAGVMDADSLDSVDTGSAIESGCGRSFSYRCRGAMARQTTTDRRSGGAVATNGIYRTFFQGQFQPDVLDIHLPQTARRPKITGVAALSAANGMNFVRFTPSCAIVRVTQGWGLDV